MELNVKKLDPDARLPEKANDEAAAFDLFANENVDIAYCLAHDSNMKVVGTGLSMAIPKGYCGLIKDRSGVSTKRQLEKLAGVIDSDYRGEVKVALRNHGNLWQGIRTGDKIAQMLIVEVPEVTVVEVDELDNTERGGKGFGSTDES